MAERQEIHSHLWYTRKRGEVKGPFPVKMVRRFVLLGRLALEDEASQDGASWQPIAQLPALVPREVLEAHTEEGYQRLLAARMREDERTGDRRHGRGGAPEAERRRRQDRRGPEPEPIQEHRASRKQRLEAPPGGASNLAPGLGWTAILVAVLAGALFVYRSLPIVPERHIDCASAPAPGVQWSNCRLEGLGAPGVDLREADADNADLRGAELRGADLRQSNLAYTNLSTADLSYSDLRGARLVGAGLRRTDLSYTRLAGADLSYADLRGANLGGAELADVRLDKAIWLDGRVCAAGSVGRCAPVAP